MPNFKITPFVFRWKFSPLSLALPFATQASQIEPIVPLMARQKKMGAKSRCDSGRWNKNTDWFTFATTPDFNSGINRMAFISDYGTNDDQRIVISFDLLFMVNIALLSHSPVPKSIDQVWPVLVIMETNPLMI